MDVIGVILALFLPFLLFSFSLYFFQSPSEVYSWKRSSSLEKPSVTNRGIYGGKRTNATPRHKNCVTLTHTNQVVRILPAGEVPLKDIFPKGEQHFSLPEWLKVARFCREMLSLSLLFFPCKC